MGNTPWNLQARGQSEALTKAMSTADHQDIFRRLDSLVEYDTVSSFAHAFYELIAEYTLGQGRQALWLRHRFAEYLDIETRYHRSLKALVSRSSAPFGDLRSATEKREIALRALIEQLGRPTTVGPAERGRVLLAAECYYQLGLTDRVVDRLEHAVELGAEHPLVQFALGYNRYLLAVQAFTRYSADSGAREITDEDRFRVACLRAVTAFQEGLRGDEFDGQLQWWIGNVLEAAGFPEAAATSFEKAGQIIGASEVAGQEGAGDAELGLDFDGQYRYETGDESGPITEEEVREAALLLQRRYQVSDLFD